MSGDGSKLYAWQEQEPNGKWGTIAAGLQGIDKVAPLVFRSMEVAYRYRSIAQAHAAASGRPVRIARFDLAEQKVMFE